MQYHDLKLTMCTRPYLTDDDVFDFPVVKLSMNWQVSIH